MNVILNPILFNNPTIHKGFNAILNFVFQFIIFSYRTHPSHKLSKITLSYSIIFLQNRMTVTYVKKNNDDKT